MAASLWRRQLYRSSRYRGSEPSKRIIGFDRKLKLATGRIGAVEHEAALLLAKLTVGVADGELWVSGRLQMAGAEQHGRVRRIDRVHFGGGDLTAGGQRSDNRKNQRQRAK